MKRLRHMMTVVLAVSTTAAWVGCNTPPATRWWETGQTSEVIKPGLFNSKPADSRRRYFDFYNEQIIHENVKVGTVFMGDSITQLWELDAYFQPADGVILNRGISGDLASIMAKRFEADVLQLRPRNVVILAGTNDVSRLLQQGCGDDEIVSDVTQSIAQMVKAARKAGIHTLICSILPTNADHRMHKGKKRIIPRINANLKRLAEEQDAVYVDCASAMTNANGDLRKDLADDGLHPHWKGYAIMARILRTAATANLLWL